MQQPYNFTRFRCWTADIVAISVINWFFPWWDAKESCLMATTLLSGSTPYEIPQHSNKKWIFIFARIVKYYPSPASWNECKIVFDEPKFQSVWKSWPNGWSFIHCFIKAVQKWEIPYIPSCFNTISTQISISNQCFKWFSDKEKNKKQKKKKKEEITILPWLVFNFKSVPDAGKKG